MKNVVVGQHVFYWRNDNPTHGTVVRLLGGSPNGPPNKQFAVIKIDDTDTESIVSYKRLQPSRPKGKKGTKPLKVSERRRHAPNR